MFFLVNISDPAGMLDVNSMNKPVCDSKAPWDCIPCVWTHFNQWVSEKSKISSLWPSAFYCAHIFIPPRLVSPDRSKRPDPPSSPGSLRPASVRRSSASWTPTCSELSPREHRVCRPTGRTSTRQRQTDPQACRTLRSPTTTPLLVWDCPALQARSRDIPATTAAGTNKGAGLLCMKRALICVAVCLHQSPTNHTENLLKSQACVCARMRACICACACACMHWGSKSSQKHPKALLLTPITTNGSINVKSASNHNV